jgi:hypothetical protein
VIPAYWNIDEDDDPHPRKDQPKNKEEESTEKDD